MTRKKFDLQLILSLTTLFLIGCTSSQQKPNLAAEIPSTRSPAGFATNYPRTNDRSAPNGTAGPGDTVEVEISYVVRNLNYAQFGHWQYSPGSGSRGSAFISVVPVSTNALAALSSLEKERSHVCRIAGAVNMLYPESVAHYAFEVQCK